MLQTQVGYWQNVETNRHNLVTESQNAIELGIKRDTLAETTRHNKETENVSWFNAQETQRHNIVNEDISWFNAHESQRHNRVSESLGFSQLYESSRHNRVSENLGYSQLSESKRHNLSSESIAISNWANDVRKTDIESSKAAAQVENWNAGADKSKAEADLASEKARSENSVRFNNWTTGAKNIATTVREVSDVASTWINSAGGGGEANSAFNVIKKAAKAAKRRNH